MWISNDGGLCHLRMSHHGTFNFSGTQTVTGDVDHVVHTPCDPVIAVRIATRAIAGEVHSAKSLKVRVDIALVVTINCAHLSGPAVKQHQVALTRTLKDAALTIDNG